MAIVTVGIPVYNEAKYLSETIDSVLSQTLVDIEIIISDNYSTDQSPEIAREYSEQDKRVRVIQQEENVGQLRNFCIALEESKTPYFVWLGGHDLMENDYLEKAVNHLENDQAAVMVYPRDAIIIDPKNKFLSGDACSDIDTSGIERPIKRFIHIAGNLHVCTNLHGVFRTNVLRRLPFKKVVAPDKLILAATGVSGHIRSIDTIGIRRKEIRTEDFSEKLKRWEETGVFSSGEREDPFNKLVDLHMGYLRESNKVGRLEILMNYRSLRKALYKRNSIYTRYLGK